MGTVKLTQFVHPFGRRKETTTELPDDVCEMANGQVLSCECMPNDYSKIVLYSYPTGADPDENPEVEEMMIADNGPGENSPPAVLERLIRFVHSKIAAQKTGESTAQLTTAQA